MPSDWKARYSRRIVVLLPEIHCRSPGVHAHRVMSLLLISLVTRCVKVAPPIVLCRDNDNEWLTKCYVLATLM